MMAKGAVTEALVFDLGPLIGNGKSLSFFYLRDGAMMFLLRLLQLKCCLSCIGTHIALL